jgi:hypothetical protein
MAFIPLHYGSDYLRLVLQAIDPFVDDILILYTKYPSYGHRGNIHNPDTMEQLQKICRPFKKVIWVDVTGVQQENQHRKMAERYIQQNNLTYDLILSVDADEIWNPEKLPEALHAAYNSGYHAHGIGGDCWWHFWKGTKEVNRDGFYPIRLFNLNNYVKNETIIHKGEIYHMGYAIRPEMMEYKLSCHGHKSELFPNWFQDKWVNYERGVTKQLHPVSKDIWIETEDFTGKLWWTS